MTDERLKQIWSGFEAATTRKLTGRGVENINVPHRADYSLHDEDLLPEEFSAPAEAAFAALREELGRKERKFGRKRKTATAAADKAEVTAPRSFTGSDLVKGLKATALRTERSDRDYSAFLASDAGKAVLKKHKKKRFGLF